MSSSPFDSPEFNALKATWYRKLKKSGFRDIERPDGTLADADQYKRLLNKSATEITASIAYYRQASEFLHSRRLSAKDRAIWGLHVEGKTERAIATKVKLSKSAVHERIAKLRRQAGLTFRFRAGEAEPGRSPLT